MLVSVKQLTYKASCKCVEAAARRCSVKKVFCEKGVLRNFAKFTGKQLRPSVFFNKVAGPRPATLFWKETLTQVFSCEFCKIFKNTFFHRTHLVVALECVINVSFVASLKFLSCKPEFTLTYFMPPVSFYTLWKHQKTWVVLIFSGGIEREEWHEMG